MKFLIFTILILSVFSVSVYSYAEEIPEWIKNNAKWWSENQISDGDFIQGTQYMIQQGLLEVPSSDSTQEDSSNVIPKWIKNNAGWWADGLISDTEFISSLQFLIENKILLITITEDQTRDEQLEQFMLPECDDQMFTVPIVDMNNLEYIFPLGGINPPGHTLPTEHMYFGIDEEVLLVAPADVYIVDVSGSKNLDKKDRGIRFALCEDVFGYFGHLSTLSEEIREAVKDIDCASWYTESNDLCSRELQYKVKAGTVLGTVGAHHGQVDFGTYDYRTTLDYANPSRYGIPYFIEQGKVKGWSVVCPIELYDEPLRQQLYDKVSGGIDPTCGEVMQDIKGTLQGNWFIGEVDGDWENSIAFIHDNRNPSKILISIGGGFIDPGKYEFVPETTGFFNKKFSDVTADGHIYCYEGEDPNRMDEEKPKGKIIVELVNDTELKIEYQSDNCSGNFEFNNPTIYFR